MTKQNVTKRAWTRDRKALSEANELEAHNA